MFPFVMPMSGLVGGSGSAAVLSFSLRGSASSSGSTITTPSNTVAGDLIVYAEFARNSDAAVAPTTVIPTAYTAIGSSLSATAGAEGWRLNVAYKIADSGDASTSKTGMNDNYMNKVMLVFNPGTTILTTTLSTPNAEITAGDAALQTVLASGQPTPLMVFRVIASPTNSYGYTAYSPADDGSGGSAQALNSVQVGYKFYNSGSTPADCTINITDSGAMNAAFSWYMRFT